METQNDFSQDKLFKSSAYENSKNLHKIELLNSIICKGYGNDIVDHINNFSRENLSGKTMTSEEYARLLFDDPYFKLVRSSINHNTMRKIYFWTVFWSIWFILSIVGGMIILLKTDFFSNLFF